LAKDEAGQVRSMSCSTGREQSRQCSMIWNRDDMPILVT
jgi:hypothetical protein